ncbi:MAG TPA: hypothetical protein VMK42_06135 [Anaeromyxobacteraceae bacterium]|nr:hypothetical protein [Anaeromyxobacteraceae bacterium]
MHAAGVVSLPVGALLGLVGLEVAFNAGLHAWLRRRLAVSGRALAAVMPLDTGVLSALLHLSGGPFNPFSALYVALAAILLPARWTWIQLAFSVLASAALLPLQERRSAPASTRR